MRFWIKVDSLPRGSMISQEGVKPDPNKFKGIMDLGKYITTTEY